MVEFIQAIGTDGITVGVAGLCVLVRCGQSWWKKTPINSSILVTALFNGASLFPFVLMVGAAYSAPMLDMAASSKLSISIAGVVGLLFVLGEVISPESLKTASIDTSRPAANDAADKQNSLAPSAEEHSS